MDTRLNDLEASVARIEGVADSTIALLNGVAAVLRRTAPTSEHLGKLADLIDAKASALAAAVAANSLEEDDDPIDDEGEGHPEDEDPPTTVGTPA